MILWLFTNVLLLLLSQKENFDWSEELLIYMDSLILDRNCQLQVKVSVSSEIRIRNLKDGFDAWLDIC